jgi:hypothetical protein
MTKSLVHKAAAEKARVTHRKRVHKLGAGKARTANRKTASKIIPERARGTYRNFHRSMALPATDLVVAVARAWLYQRRCRANRAVRAFLAHYSSPPRGSGKGARQGDTQSLRGYCLKIDEQPAVSALPTCDTVTKFRPIPSCPRPDFHQAHFVYQ